MESVKGFTPLAAVDEVIPLWDQVAEGATLMAERNSTVHAAGALLTQFRFRLKVEVLVVVANPLGRVTLNEVSSMNLEEAADLTHQP
jgi:hypothetical protein